MLVPEGSGSVPNDPSDRTPTVTPRPDAALPQCVPFSDEELQIESMIGEGGPIFED